MNPASKKSMSIDGCCCRSREWNLSSSVVVEFLECNGKYFNEALISLPRRILLDESSIVGCWDVDVVGEIL
jgi:hypothetical protein